MGRSIGRDALLLGSAGAAAGGLVAALLSGRQPLDLKGKVVLITGGSRGLGLALARGFAKEGSSLVLCARNQEELKLARQDLAGMGADVMTVACDVGYRAQVEELVEAAVARYGRLDVVVNNAGTIQVGPIQAMTIDDFERAMNVMFWGVVYTTLAALPHLRKQPQSRVVNITSVGAKVSVPHLVPYSCAKFAAVAFSEGMRAELHGTGVEVVTIAPGLMRTGSYLNALFKGDQASEAAWFSVSASLPGLSMSATRAARQIISATRAGRGERILSAPANLLARFHGLFPEITTDILGLINRLLPSGAGNAIARGAEIPALQNRWLQILTTLGRRAATRFLQPGAPQFQPLR